MRLAPALLSLCVSGCAFDPAQTFINGKGTSRSQSCVRLSQAEAHRRFPGVVPDLAARRYLAESDAVVCEPLFMSDGERPARDEALLSTLSADIAELTTLATARHPETVTWHVDAYYPDVAVASKLAVAAKSQLAERGLAVSDRAPVLAAGDVAVLSRLPPSQAYAVACARYYAEHSLTEKDVLLGLMLVDPRETKLHAGVCSASQWRWLR